MDNGCLAERKPLLALAEADIRTLRPFMNRIYTMTADNEEVQSFSFGFHEKIARNPNILIYFAKLCHSWERGTDENTDGVIRRYFPKGTDFGVITEAQVKCVQNILNSRQGKRLGYMTLE